jgi:hypothetical protein
MSSSNRAAARPFRPVRALSAFALIAVLVVAAAVLIVFRSAAQTGDSLEYARSIRSGELLFHPHHLLFNPIVRGLWKGMAVIFPEVSPITAAQVHNIFWALVVLAAVFVLVRRMTGSIGAAALGSLALFSFLGFWQYTTYVEVYVPMMGCLAVVLAGLQIIPKDRISLGLGGGLAAVFTLAVFYDQTSVFFSFPLVILMASRLGKRGVWKAVGLLAAAGTTVLAGYLFAFLTTSNPRTLAGFCQWCLSYAFQPDPSWGSWSNVSPLGAAKLLLSFARITLPIARHLFLPAVICSGLVVASLAVGTLAAIRRRAADIPWRIALSLWIGTTVAFMWWFSPSGYELAIPLLLPFLLLAVRTIADFWESSADSRKARRRSLGFLTAAVTGLFILNFVGAVLPARADRGDAFHRAALVQSAAPQNAIVVADYYMRENLRYYFDRPGTLEDVIILYSFYRNLTLPPEYVLGEERPVLIPIAMVVPDSKTVKPYHGDSHPREWRAFVEWFAGCEIRDGRVVSARPVVAANGLPGYLLVSGERRPVGGLDEVFRDLDEAARTADSDPSRPFLSWLTRHPDLKR